MIHRLKIVTLEEDVATAEIVKSFARQSSVATIIRNFNKASDFLEQLPRVHFDYCLIDSDIKDSNGLMPVQMLNSKPFILLTDGEKTNLKEAIALSPIEVILKPLVKDKLDKAFEKAYRLIAREKEYGLFRVAEYDNRINLRINEMAVIVTDEVDPRHKNVFMQNGDHYTLMDYSMNEILALSPLFVQVNKSSIVNIKVIKEVTHDTATIHLVKSTECAKYVNIGQSYKNNFLERFFYR
jgi:DNA-binding LytR/AlgR family response regulator